MKWTLGFGGALAGFVGTVALAVSLGVYTGRPGMFVSLVQLAIVGFVSGTLGGLGFCIGCLIDLGGRMASRQHAETGVVSRDVPAMKRGTRIVVASCVVVWALSFLALVVLIGIGVHKVVDTGTGPREVPRREVRLRFRQVTGRKLPKSADHLRAILGNGRPGAIFVRFETDRRGQDEVAATLAGEGAMGRELDPGELAELKQSPSALFERAVAWQGELGVDLYEPSSIRSAQVWEGRLKLPSPRPGQTGDDLLYQVLIDHDSGVVYVFAARE
jgi:hypothetical protein